MVTLAELAAYLGVTSGYLRRIVADRHIQPAGRIGRAHLYRVADITRHTGHNDRLAQRPDLR